MTWPFVKNLTRSLQLTIMRAEHTVMHVIHPSGERIEVIWGDRVRGKRRQLGLSQQALAEHVGCDQATISRIESGRIIPTDVQKWRICGKFRVPVGDIFPWPRTKPPVREQVSA